MKKDDTKMRVLAIERLFLCRGSVSMSDILRHLDLEYDIQADRRTIYDDIAVLTRFLPIRTEGRCADYRYILNETEV